MNMPLGLGGETREMLCVYLETHHEVGGFLLTGS